MDARTLTNIEVPERIRQLPVDARGYHVPYFVHWDHGVPDFRVVGVGKIRDAIRYHQCWTCGQKLGRYMAFVIGPMCAVNRVSSEPPSHLECARYAAHVCPFLTRPHMRRNEHNLPENQGMAGIGELRNPGVTLIWVTRGFQPFRDGKGVLFNLGEPEKLEWYREGRTATREEILHSIETGFPKLQALAELDGPRAVRDLQAQLKHAVEKLVPA